MEISELKKIVEGALLAAGRPLTLDDMLNLFGNDEDYQPDRDSLKQAISQIEQETADKGFELKRVASGYRFQVRQELSPWISRLWQEKQSWSQVEYGALVLRLQEKCMLLARNLSLLTAATQWRQNAQAWSLIRMQKYTLVTKVQVQMLKDFLYS